MLLIFVNGDANFSHVTGPRVPVEVQTAYVLQSHSLFVLLSYLSQAHPGNNTVPFCSKIIMDPKEQAQHSPPRESVVLKGASAGVDKLIEIYPTAEYKKDGVVAATAAESTVSQGKAAPASSWWISDQLLARFAGDKQKVDEGEEDIETAEVKAFPTRVSLISLLSYSTLQERILMAFGLLMSIVSGFAVPTWLVLLAKGLDRFSNLAYLINAGANLADVVQNELNSLVIAFAVLGVFSLVAGALYVSIWTYTGEQQALRIKERYVQSVIHQDAAWFDHHNRDELPTKVREKRELAVLAFMQRCRVAFCTLYQAITNSPPRFFLIRLPMQ